MMGHDASRAAPQLSDARAVDSVERLPRVGGAARHAVLLRGIVQGVGLRPFVHGLAARLHLAGFVQNRADGVLIEVEGDVSGLRSFVELLRTSGPPRARIEEIGVTELACRRERGFRIVESDATGSDLDRFFSADVGTCADCLDELFDPADRRYEYPFVNCTNCGPRWTIVREAPYDRPRTTMALFAMCEECRAEYDSPTDRRFHAQPIACPRCGPSLSARDGDGALVRRSSPIDHARRLLLEGHILALKGLGGYHFACDATNDAAVARLRGRKDRDAKPFAVLVADLEAARRLCHVSEAEAELLASPQRPIVLLRALPAPPIAPSVAPDNPSLGVMLPYTPLHHLLARELSDRPLVLTSANRGGEPIVFDDEDAVERLRGIADGMLTHDRPIQLGCDDSVARVVGKRPVLLRRSRGYAPEPMRLPFSCNKAILALGGQLKSTFALGRGGHAFMSHHLGDLGDLRAYRAYLTALQHYRSLFAFDPALLVHDLHPAYATSEYARVQAERGVPVLAVQHHHAHMASCMAEHRLSRSAIGVTFDGTGYGSDGSLWGGEFLVGDYRAVRRAAHLRAVPLPGGERAIREPWRMALSYLVDSDEASDELLRDVPSPAARVVRRMLAQRINSPDTSSMGRLFDATAWLLGHRAPVSFEGQAALWLERLAGAADAPRATYPFEVIDTPEDGLTVDTRPLLRALVTDRRNGEPPAEIAGVFHRTIAEMVRVVVCLIRDQTSINDVVLTGGVFMNALLLEHTSSQLRNAGLAVYSHAIVPPNDGGLALGQLAVAAASLQGEP